jgi:pimeloyl-ACP methyl ester carboxylesterase
LTAIETGTVTVDGVSTFFRRVPGDGPPAVFVHGNPNSSRIWVPFLERIDGPAVAFDLPGWGRSERPPPADFDYSMEGLARFITRFQQRMAIEDHSLVVHDWGAVALIPAQEEPERIRRLIVSDAVPLLPGYHWHRTARLWRTPVVGEATRLLSRRSLVDLGLRESRGDWSRHDPVFVDDVHEHLRNRRTTEVIVRLYRSGEPDRLAAAGERLGGIEAPALVVWGDRDRYLPTRFATAYAERLPRAELVIEPGTGHWPWLERPELVDRMLAFLGEK